MHAALTVFLAQLVKVEDVDTEVFELFANAPQDGSNLGMLAASQETLEVSIGGHDYTIAQSPGLLVSNNAQGTTGAAAWQSGIRFSRWLARPDNALFAAAWLSGSPVVLELGSGVAGLVSSVLSSRCGSSGKVIASDMAYAQKLLRQNISEHVKAQGRRKTKQTLRTAAPVEVAVLDWEQDDAVSLLKSLGCSNGVDLVVACDCIYNYALIKPFLETCSSICAMRSNINPGMATLAIVVQQLRQPEVFEEWLNHASTLFDVWRIPQSISGTELSETDGFVIHALIVK